MTIRIDANELYELLRLTPAEQNIMLIGKHGIGKSEIISDFFKKQGMKVVAFFLGQMSDPGDLIGLMHKDEKTGQSVFLPPYWWPVEGNPIVLFLDELNRARPEILQAVQDLTLNKTLAGKRLPKGSIVISAVNEGEEYQLTDLDPALVSRFNLYEFAPTVEEWLLWASSKEIDQRLITFIQKNRHYLDGDGINREEAEIVSGLTKTPDRRAWVKVSDFIKPLKHPDDLHTKIIAGMVGTPAALVFKQSLAAAAKVTAEQILLNFSRHKKKLKELSLQEIIMLNEQIIFWINSGKYDKDKEEKVRKNMLAYLKELKKGNNNEPLAHIASMAESPGFETVMALMAESMDIMNLLMDYIQGIKV
ncbi:MAG: AAA domain-containing protein [Desulfobacteraceae bacterium]|nr:AAA domain-containing protein [Desulfobacteraceae bacterium]